MSLPEHATMRRRLFWWRWASPLRANSRLRGRETKLTQLAAKNQALLERLNTLYVEARLYLRRQDRKDCQKIIVDAVDAALNATSPRSATKFLTAGAKRAQAVMCERAVWVTRWGTRSKVRPLREDPLVPDAVLNQVWKAQPVPVGQLHKAYLEAQLYLRRRDLETCLEMIRSAIHVSAKRPASKKRMLETEADRVNRFLSERAEQTARRVYTTGLYIGIVVSAAVLVVTWFLIKNTGVHGLGNVLVCIGGGAVGAVVSTILRVSKADKIDFRVIAKRTATFRIVLGWLFAAAVFFLIEGDIVTVFDVPSDDDCVESFFFWGAVGFLAGFNEKWARNLITRTDPPDKRKPADTAKPAAATTATTATKR